MKKLVFAAVVMGMLAGTQAFADKTNIAATVTYTTSTNVIPIIDTTGSNKVVRTIIYDVKTLTFTWDGEDVVVVHQPIKDVSEETYVKKETWDKKAVAVEP